MGNMGIDQIQESWLTSWLNVKLTETDGSSVFGLPLTSTIIGGHLQALVCALALTAFGIFVLAYDTRQPSRGSRHGRNYLRDRIAGVEQRYFLVLLNGVLLYVALAFYIPSRVSSSTIT